MDMNPVFFRVNDNTIINIAHIVRFEPQKKADGTQSVRFWTTDKASSDAALQASYILEGERLKAFLRLVGTIH